MLGIIKKALNIKTLACGVLAGLACVSCSEFVFEDREHCPAYVFIKAEPAILPSTWSSLNIGTWEDGRRQEDRTVSVYDLNSGFYVAVSKNTYFEASLLGGWPEDWHGEGCLLVPEGNECPEGVGAYFGIPIDKEEIYNAPLALTSLYANVIFTVKGADAGYAFDIFVDGIVDGFLYPGTGLHYGPFHAKAREVEYLRREVRIPRQVAFAGPTKADGAETADRNALDHLTATVYVENAQTGAMGKYVTIPVGKTVKESPYDWGALSLEDIHVELRMFRESIASVTVRIAGWEKVIIGDNNGSYHI